MLPLDDPRWAELEGGYRVLYDPRPALRDLQSGQRVESAWHDLWHGLHHQGDIGLASYAAVPHVVRIYMSSPAPDANPHALVTLVELLRLAGDNPELPTWLEPSYHESIQRLGERALADLATSSDPDVCQQALASVALAKGLHHYAKVLSDYTNDEVAELISQ